MIFPFSQTTHLTSVILSGARERFVPCVNHRRAVEGSRECVPLDVASGSSHQNVIPAPWGLDDSSYIIVWDPLWLPCTAHQVEAQAVAGTGSGENSLQLAMMVHNASGFFDFAPISLVSVNWLRRSAQDDRGKEYRKHHESLEEQPCACL